MFKKQHAIGPSDVRQYQKANYEQIDTIRFLTITIIVWAHSLFSQWHVRPSEDLFEQIIKATVLQAGSISTVIFFIVSGILIHSKLQAYNLPLYINERARSIYFPWIFIVCFNAVLIMLHRLPLQELWNTRNFDQFILSSYSIMNGLLIYGPYWFVVTYFVGMVILIVFKKYTESIFFGLCLAVITLFYGMNFHMRLIDTQHSKAVLAYTFFIWLGFPIHSNWNYIISFAQKLKWNFLIGGLFLMFCIASYEGVTLSEAGVNDPFASNRLSNITFSIIFFLFLLKIGAIRIINNLNPRKIVFGIYLINSIVVLELSILLNEFFHELGPLNIWSLLGLQLIYFLLILFITYLIVNTLKKSPLRWMIGVK